MKHAGFLVAGIVLAVVGIGAWTVFSNYDLKEKVVKTAPSAEAQNDDFLALKRTFVRRGYFVQRVTGSDEFWKFPSSIVVTNERFLLRLNQENKKKLDQWLQRPVVLVVLWKSLKEKDLSDAGRQWMLEHGGELDESDDDPDATYEREPRLILANGKETLISVNWGKGPSYKSRQSDWTAQGLDASGSVRWLEFGTSTSRVIWTTSGSFWKNSALAQGDHAKLLERLELAQGARNVALVQASQGESEPVPPEWSALLLPVVLVLLLAIWRHSVRTVPVFEEKESARTSLRERYQAEGSYLWHSSAKTQLVEKLVADAVGYLDGRFPGRPRSEQFLTLFELTKIPVSEWERVFSPQKSINAAHVRFVVDRLEILRRVV